MSRMLASYVNEQLKRQIALKHVYTSLSMALAGWVSVCDSFQHTRTGKKCHIACVDVFQIQHVSQTKVFNPISSFFALHSVEMLCGMPSSVCVCVLLLVRRPKVESTGCREAYAFVHLELIKFILITIEHFYRNKSQDIMCEWWAHMCSHWNSFLVSSPPELVQTTWKMNNHCLAHTLIVGYEYPTPKMTCRSLVAHLPPLPCVRDKTMNK